MGVSPGVGACNVGDAGVEDELAKGPCTGENGGQEGDLGPDAGGGVGFGSDAAWLGWGSKAWAEDDAEELYVSAALDDFFECAGGDQWKMEDREREWERCDE